ncbi:hypothetical protein KJ765_00750 [Candidatus Micrarchaeota archaeon]|nr:hypothetical protein [Candidatus Micrarchaeota archaeon]
MRLPAIALLLASILVSVHALSIEDEASFYAEPGEKSAYAPLLYDGQDYFLILVDNRPVALLTREGIDLVIVQDTRFIDLILREFVAAGFPSILLVTEEGKSYASVLKNEQFLRQPAAERRKIIYSRDIAYRDLLVRRDILFKKLNALREVELVALDDDLVILNQLLRDMRQAHSLEAVEKFASRFDTRLEPAVDRVENLESIVEAHYLASRGIANASRAIDKALIRFGTDSELLKELKRDLLALEYDMTQLEASISTGKPLETRDFSPIATGARVILRESEGKTAFPWVWYAFSLILLGLLVAGSYLFYKKYRPRSPKEALTIGQRILRNFRLFEEKEERNS